MSQLKCVIVTPETTVRDDAAEFVALPLFDGELGVASGHSPMIGRLGFGELRIKVGGQTERFYVDGGFVQVAGNVVSVMTNRAISSDKLDSKTAAEQLKGAQARTANSEELLALRERAVAQARAQVRVAQRAGR